MVTHPTQSPPARRIALFCSEALRPAACCVVDALEIRGYAARLWTGRNAGAALQRSRRRQDADLRVVFAPEALDPDLHRRLVRGLDPAGHHDLLLLAFDRPRDAIEAIERATGRQGPRPLRARPSRAVLAHPTLLEAKLEFRRWLRPALAGTATFAALTTAIVFGGAVGTPNPTAPRVDELAVAAPASDAPVRISDGITLAAGTADWSAYPSARGALRDGSDASFDAEIDRAFEDSFEEDLIIIEDEFAFADEPPTEASLASVRNAANAATDALYRDLADERQALPAATVVAAPPAAPPAAASASRHATRTLADPFAL